MHIHLSPQVLEDFSDNLSRRSLAHEVLCENTQDLLDDDSLCCPNANEKTFDTCYHTLNEVSVMISPYEINNTKKCVLGNWS